MEGIFTKFIPLLKILDAKLLTSPVMPPPIDIIQSSLEKFLFNKISIFYKDKPEENFEKMSKSLVAEEIVKRIIQQIN